MLMVDIRRYEGWLAMSLTEFVTDFYRIAPIVKQEQDVVTPKWHLEKARGSLSTRGHAPLQ
jgi:hypothetical protein